MNEYPSSHCVRRAPPFFLGMVAGVRPALAAATLMTGVAGIWSYVKKSI